MSMVAFSDFYIEMTELAEYGARYGEYININDIAKFLNFFSEANGFYLPKSKKQGFQLHIYGTFRSKIFSGNNMERLARDIGKRIEIELNCNFTNEYILLPVLLYIQQHAYMFFFSFIFKPAKLSFLLSEADFKSSLFFDIIFHVAF